MTLEQLRKNLSAVDRRLVELIAKRQQIVGDIGKSKVTTGAGTRDYAREKDVLDMGREQAKELGVDPDLVESLLQQLIRTSLESQERDRVIAEGKGDGRRALVIGGAGKMGRWFVDFFASQGFATTGCRYHTSGLTGTFQKLDRRRRRFRLYRRRGTVGRIGPNTRTTCGTEAERAGI